MDIASLLGFLHAAERLKCSERHCSTSSGRRESVAEHSWRLALTAELIRGEFPELDMDRVVEMCLFHDLGEAVTGDIPTFVKTDSDRRVESGAVDSLLSLLGEPERSRAAALFAEMEALETPEAKLYKALDKLEALIQHNEADISEWLPNEYSLQLCYGDAECGFSDFTKRLREAVRLESEEKINAFPKISRKRLKFSQVCDTILTSGSTDISIFMEEIKMALPVALQLYSIRDDVQKDMKAALVKVKEMGYAGVEFAGLYGNSPADIKAMCAEVGLTPISAHVPIDEMVKDPEGTIAAYAEIGCKFIVVPYVIEERRPGGSKFDQTIEDMKMIGAVAKKHGLTLLYHNHDFEFVKIDGTYGLDLIYERVPADLLQTEIDTCWANVGGVDPSAYLLKYTGRAPVVHLKDFSGEKSDDMYELIGIEKKAPTRPSNFEFRPFGFGYQNVPNILDAAVKAGAGWVVVEQDQPSMGKTPLECAAMSRAYLKLLGW